MKAGYAMNLKVTKRYGGKFTARFGGKIKKEPPQQEAVLFDYLFRVDFFFTF